MSSVSLRIVSFEEWHRVINCIKDSVMKLLILENQSISRL